MLVKSLDRGRVEVLGIGVPRAGPSPRPPMVAEWEVQTSVALGLEACRELASQADILLCAWIDDLAAVLGNKVSPRPIIVMVSHIDADTEWVRGIQAQDEIDHHAAVSRSALASLPAEKRAGATVIPNAIDVERLTPSRTPDSVRSSLNIPAWAPVLGFLGRLDPDQKDPAALVRALDHLPQGWHGLWVGDDPDGGRVGGLIASAAHLGGRAHFAGGRRDIANYLQIMTRLLMPSCHEASPLVALEAWAFGLPLLMTDIGLPEAVRFSHPIPIDADGPNLAAAILADCNTPDAGTRARGAQAWVAEDRSLRAFGSAWTDAILRWSRGRAHRGQTHHRRAHHGLP